MLPGVVKKQGFSLIELLLGLSLLAALFVCGLLVAPSLYQTNKIQTVAYTLKTAINFAKTEALSTGESLVLAPLSASDWSKGMVLFVDHAHHHQWTPDVTSLHEWRWSDPNLRVIWRGFQSDNYLLFSPEMSRYAVNGYFLIFNKSQRIQLVVNRLGRVTSPMGTSLQLL
jgi:prepilin-type N-terminal cleavage/methylation domain-containing protein